MPEDIKTEFEEREGIKVIERGPDDYTQRRVAAAPKSEDEPRAEAAAKLRPLPRRASKSRTAVRDGAGVRRSGAAREPLTQRRDADPRREPPRNASDRAVTAEEPDATDDRRVVCGAEEHRGPGRRDAPELKIREYAGRARAQAPDLSRNGRVAFRNASVLDFEPPLCYIGYEELAIKRECGDG